MILKYLQALCQIYGFATLRENKVFMKIKCYTVYMSIALVLRRMIMFHLQSK